MRWKSPSVNSRTAASAIGPSAASTGEARRLHGQRHASRRARARPWRRIAHEARRGSRAPPTAAWRVDRSRRRCRGSQRAARPRAREVRRQIGALGHAFPQPVGVLVRERLGVPQPVDDLRGLAEMVLMRGKAAAGFGVGEVEREIVGDEGKRTGARRGGLENNRHLRLYKLCTVASVRKLTL